MTRRRCSAVLGEVKKIEGEPAIEWNYGEARRLIWRARRATEGQKELLAQARKHLNACAAGRANWPPVFIARGELDELEQKPEQAMASYRQALELGSRDPHCIYQLLDLLTKAHRTDEAEQLDPNNGSGRNRYAYRAAQGVQRRDQRPGPEDGTADEPHAVPRRLEGLSRSPDARPTPRQRRPRGAGRGGGLRLRGGAGRQAARDVGGAGALPGEHRSVQPGAGGDQQGGQAARPPRQAAGAGGVPGSARRPRRGGADVPQGARRAAALGESAAAAGRLPAPLRQAARCRTALSRRARLEQRRGR